MARRVFVCGILPPHILRNIAEHADDDGRRMARATLDLSSYIRGERAVMAALPAMLAVAPGEKRRTVYDAESRRDLPGVRVRWEGGKKSRDAAVEEAFDGSGKTYDFYREVFARNSIDGRGMRLDSTVHYAVHFANAQWNGRQMIYGDGDGKIFGRFTRSLDVIGHELTHGVTQCTAALAYHDQPGALNEHFSDVFGTLVKQYSNKQKAASADWLIGAELFARGVRGVAVRSMRAPGTAYDDPVLGRDPQPSTMSGYVEGDEDNGGVHVNSGIPNHAFYLVANALGGFAWETAGKIWYQTLTRKLHAEATFADAAAATFEAAGELFGNGSEPQKAVAVAWEQVGVTASPAASKAKLPVRRRKTAPEFDIAAAGAELPNAIFAATRK